VVGPAQRIGRGPLDPGRYRTRSKPGGGELVVDAPSGVIVEAAPRRPRFSDDRCLIAARMPLTLMVETITGR
jgi:hypothetical protein